MSQVQTPMTSANGETAEQTQQTQPELPMPSVAASEVPEIPAEAATPAVLPPAEAATPAVLPEVTCQPDSESDEEYEPTTEGLLQSLIEIGQNQLTKSGHCEMRSMFGPFKSLDHDLLRQFSGELDAQDLRVDVRYAGRKGAQISEIAKNNRLSR